MITMETVACLQKHGLVYKGTETLIKPFISDMRHIRVVPTDSSHESSIYIVYPQLTSFYKSTVATPPA
jgi:hypothetical protein